MISPREIVTDTIETMQLEERRYPPPPAFAAQANAQVRGQAEQSNEG